jgi:hypothetical protein
MTHTTTYSNARTVELSFDDALTRTRAALADEGFGVLFEIDVQATMNAKLGVSREPYVILGACNPQLADRALAAEPSSGSSFRAISDGVAGGDDDDRARAAAALRAPVAAARNVPYLRP